MILLPKKEAQLKEELDEFKKEKERIRSIVGQIGGANNSQHKIINFLFVVLIIVLLILGVVLQKITLFLTLEVAVLLGIFKLIWMFYEAQRASHFQFWILNSLEYRINEVDRRVKKIEKLLTKDQEVKKDVEEDTDESISEEQQTAE
ncbi:hypothetical protein [Fusobacterium sp.]|uniref:hypothetical protein n=1 Tax=Fusobacterium sp. TaxID=68766 RepID=UPI003966E214